MTAAVLAQVPLAAGGALLSVTGTAIHWGIGRFMRAPLANAGILTMVTLTAMAGSNALYLQRHEHPAPLFGAIGDEVERQAVAEPVIPATRPARELTVVAAPASPETTGSVPAIELPLGNAEVNEIQRKLHAMQIFDGAIDGLYGPRTARAIRTFEQRMGMKPRGELTWPLLEAVRKAPVMLPEPAVAPLPAPDPLPEAKQAPASTAPAAVATEPAAVQEPVVAAEPLPTPEPLQLAAIPAARPEPVLRRELPANAEEALAIAVETAGDAIDTIIAGVQTIAMTRPGKKEAAVPAPASTTSLSTTPTAVADTAAALPPAVRAEPQIALASATAPKVGVTLALPEQQESRDTEVAALDTDATAEELQPAFSVNDPLVVARVQRALASLGFLHGPADGVAGEATAKAIRNFEVYYNYDVTGRITPDLLDLLVQRGATI
jgi:peptidoglycan hydrolase-like protein with peptidoglycan-binding domain